MMTLTLPETQSQNGCNDFLNALPGRTRSLLSDCVLIYLEDSVEIYAPSKTIERQLCKQSISIYRKANQILGVSELSINSDNGRFVIDKATADNF